MVRHGELSAGIFLKWEGPILLVLGGVGVMSDWQVVGLGLLVWVVVIAAGFVFGFWAAVGLFAALVILWAKMIVPE